VTDPLTLVRSVHFAATVLAVGTVSFLVLVAEPANTKVRADFVALRHQLNVLTWLALAVAILSGAAWLVLLASDILGAPLVDICLHGGRLAGAVRDTLRTGLVRAAGARAPAWSVDTPACDAKFSACRSNRFDRLARPGRSCWGHAGNGGKPSPRLRYGAFACGRRMARRLAGVRLVALASTPHGGAGLPAPRNVRL